MPIQFEMSSSKKRPHANKSETEIPLTVALVIFVFGVILVFKALMHKEAPIDPEVEAEKARSAALEREQKVSYYRKQLGDKINRSRVIAEYEFANEQAESIQVAKRELIDVNGLPMDYEQRQYAPREESKKAAEILPDHNVAYDLKDDQNAEFWEEEARRMFLRKYLLNARAQGYDLAIDSNYNVIVRRAPKQARSPQNVAADRSARSIQSFQPLRLRPPFYLPPICQTQ